MASYIYHFYEDILHGDPLLNRRKPVLFSIASLRRYQPTAKVFIVDTSLASQDWASYQRELDFEVIPSEANPIPIGYPLADGRSMERLWNLIDHTQITDEVVVSVSSDLIFLDDPEPIPGMLDSLVGGDRDGLFAFRRTSEKAKWMMRKWQGLCSAFVQGGPFQREVSRFNLGRQVNEYVLLSYFLSHEVPDGWLAPSGGVNAQFFHFTVQDATQDLRSVCLNESFVGFDKVRVILAFKELHAAVRRASWMDRFDVEPVFELKDLEIRLEEIQEYFYNDQSQFFQRHDGSTLWESNFARVYNHGRPNGEIFW